MKSAEPPFYLLLRAQDLKAGLRPEEGRDDKPFLVHAALPRIALAPDDAAIAAGVSRTRIFDAIRKGRLIARGDGKATLIEVSELARWIASLPAKGPRRTTVEKHSQTINDSEKAVNHS
jgi:hypothetical protein